MFDISIFFIICLQGERRGLLVSGGSTGTQIQASTLFFDINLGQWAKLGDMNTRRLQRNMLDFFNQSQADLGGGREWST